MNPPHEPLAFELDAGDGAGGDGNRRRPGTGSNFVPPLDVPDLPPGELLPGDLLREGDAPIPDLSPHQVARHFSRLARLNWSVDSGTYPLGSCTMKYSPKIAEEVARLPGFAQVHPLQEEVDGALEVLATFSELLCHLTGMDAFTFQPAAGAHGEFTGLLVIKKYFEARGERRDVVVVPDSAHGTNPASAAMAGMRVVELACDSGGEVPIDHLKAALEGGDVAAVMLTNPNTLGLFDRRVVEVTKLVHARGGLCYYDGANLNALLGRVRPGDLGFDVVHLNLHKSFATPHGGGGPGAGPVGVREFLVPHLPEPCVFPGATGPVCREGTAESIGRVRAFWGNFGVVLRAFTYVKALGGAGLKRAATTAVLNANYLRARLRGHYRIPHEDRHCMHEFVLSDAGLPNGVTTEDVAKRLLDFGVHAPTVYFPLVVPGAMLVEPTETESKQELDHLANALARVRREAEEEPDKLKNAPLTTPVGRLDATLAARKPRLAG
ncbi:MAG: aminomethyl-transferring glycine dehydrogenase subunit GcvPB [Promethearchaeota archaeon]